MIDWEDPFDLEALASQDSAEESEFSGRLPRRALSFLRHEGLLEFEIVGPDEDMTVGDRKDFDNGDIDDEVPESSRD